MSFVELLLIAIGLSMDAFSVSICKGLTTKKFSWRMALVCGLWFGFFQALMPIIGYFLGAILADYIFEPFMKGSSKLRQLLTHVVGEGSGAGISLIFILAGLIGFVLTLVLRNNKYIKELN